MILPKLWISSISIEHSLCEAKSGNSSRLPRLTAIRTAFRVFVLDDLGFDRLVLCELLDSLLLCQLDSEKGITHLNIVVQGLLPSLGLVSR
jgi:hypothetical protein